MTTLDRGFTALVGKTIKAIDKQFANCIGITFTDGTKVTVDTESIGYGIYTPVIYKDEE